MGWSFTNVHVTLLVNSHTTFGQSRFTRLFLRMVPSFGEHLYLESPILFKKLTPSLFLTINKAEDQNLSINPGPAVLPWDFPAGR